MTLAAWAWLRERVPLPVIVGVLLGVAAALVLLWLYPDRVLDLLAIVGILGGGTAAGVAVMRRPPAPTPEEVTEEIVERSRREVEEAADHEGEPLHPTRLTLLGDDTADRWRRR